MAGVVTQARAQPASAPLTNQILVVEMVGKVEVSPAGTDRWFPAATNQMLLPGDRLRTGMDSRAVVRWSNHTMVPLDRNSGIQVPSSEQKRGILQLLRGAIYFYHRDKPTEFSVETPAMAAIIRGTEFHVRAAENGTTTLQVIDGEVEVANEFGRLRLQSGEAAVAEAGQAPVRTATLEAVNVIQWCLYYPGVLDVDELGVSGIEQSALSESLAAYRNGDVLAALALYPEGREPASDAEKIYRAALLLVVGDVEQVEALLSEVRSQRAGVRSETGRLADALRKVIAAVKFQTYPPDGAVPSHPIRPLTPALSPDGDDGDPLATQSLAESYYQQSRWNLEAALDAARKAVRRAPRFAFARARVAELEFSFGRTKAALDELEKSLLLAPRNAQAVALKGFLLAAQNRMTPAQTHFEEAIALDGSLGNAWLGRGLCRIRQGQIVEGLQDLQVAAALEPHRAVLRSYLGKAYGEVRDDARARKEIAMAKQLDPSDPTSWLYSALLYQEHNRINAAVRELQRSQDLNDNRQVYRSSLLLEQDRAVRSANLAHIYQDAGLLDVSLWEASRAASADGANYSAHLFLANSYQQLRDPRGINQRFETPAVSEYLLASLLAPVGAGTLAQSVSQQEYSKLFARDGLGVAGSVEYLSRGDWIASGAQYGTLQNTEYALSGYYRSETGQRANNDLEQHELSFQFKQQITPAGTAYFRVVEGRADGGDLAPYYDPTLPFNQGGPNLAVRTREVQEPLLLLGYHHEWAPGSHTLFLGGRLADTYTVSNPQQVTYLFNTNAAGTISGVFDPFTIEQQYESELKIYTAEAQQLWQRADYGFVVGARYQAGDFETYNQHGNVTNLPPFSLFPGLLPAMFPTRASEVASQFERASVYGYLNWRVPVGLTKPLQLVGGVAYDWLKYPLNHRYAPLSSAEETTDQISPKGGFVWTPTRSTTLRSAYTKSLGGATLDQSIRLEPTQVAGFNQAFRSLLPEAVAGANAAAPFETWGASFEQRLGRGTFLGVSGEIIESRVERTLGVYLFQGFGVPTAPGSTREELNYRERSLTLSLSQLVGESWSFGARYRWLHSELADRFTDVLAAGLPQPSISPNFQPARDLESTLHHVHLFAVYNHRSGFFGEAQSLWDLQSNQGYAPDRPGDDFWQFNIFAGYRFWRRQAELRFGVLNLTDQDYRLNPLNLTPDLPRERTFLTSFRFYF